jgi:Uma2 family endonuclease
VPNAPFSGNLSARPVAQPIVPIYRYSEYLEQLERSHIRLEFLEGIVYAMAGGSPRHNKLCARVAAQVGSHLQSGCEAYSPDQRIRAQGAGMFPDFTVVYGPEEFASDDPDAIVNPTLVVEVLSPSTAATDQTSKADRYQSLKSLRELVLVWQDECRVQVRRRTADGGWELHDHRAGQLIELSSCGARLDVDALYRDLADGP